MPRRPPCPSCRRHRRRQPRPLLALLLVIAAACGPLEALRAALHPPPPEARRPASLAADQAGLRVEVTPSAGLTLLVDGRAVAHASPWQGAPLAAGAHVIEVRAMGYLPVRLPIDLAGGQTTVLPIALRPRPAEVPRLDVPPPAAEPAPPPAPAGAGELGPPLPADLAPVHLVVACRPAVPILVDGQPAGLGQVVLARQQGTLRVGPLQLGYAVDAGRRVTMVIPDDGGSWTQDLSPVHAQHRFVITASPAHLRRESLDGSDQSLVLRRRD